MRVEKLFLERYGVYDKLSVPLASPRLNVVYGPNEAGKSTCLEAISDLLFGIPPSSSRGQVYGYDSMRIGAILRLADGTTLDLRRRKGRGRTLLDQNGKPVDDSLLGKLLGAVTRKRFSTMFGLDHRSLREGGETLLSAEGDVGRLILEAGGGLRALVKSVEKLKQEADSLFASRRSESRRFYLVLNEFEQAQESVKRGTLTFEFYQQAKQCLKDAKTKHSGLKEDRARLELRQSALQRAARVLPMLRELDQIERRLKAAGMSHT